MSIKKLITGIVGGAVGVILVLVLLVALLGNGGSDSVSTVNTDDVPQAQQVGIQNSALASTSDVSVAAATDSTSQTEQITEPAPIELSGTGQKATQKFQLEQGLSEFSMTYRGGGNFIVWLMDGETGLNIDLLANEIGSFNGSTAVGITADGDYILNVQADGPWTVSITQPRQSPTQSAPLTLQGTGKKASELFTLDYGLKTFEMNYRGADNFIVWLMDDQGNRVDLLANEIGSFDGSKAIGIPQTGTYLLNIESNGKWEISIKE